MVQDYKNWIQGIFDRSAQAYGEAGSSYFDALGRKLVKFARLNRNDTVLDIATGKGAVLKAIAEQLNGHGKIYGIDLSPEMINATKASISGKFTNIHLQQMDAENLTFPNHYFDAIFCAFALFFFPNPQQALKEFIRTLKKEGKIYLSLWDGDSYLDVIAHTMAQKMGTSKEIIANELDLHALRNLLHDLGFIHFQIEKNVFIQTYDNPEQWWNSLWSHAYRGYLEQLDDKKLQAMKNEVFDKIKPYLNEHGQLVEEMPYVFIEAQAALT